MKLDIPEFKAPDMKMPDMKMPDVKMPDVKMPSFSMPKIDLPDMPKIDMPEMPKSTGAPAISAPKFDIPKAPSISMPKIDVRTEEDANVEPQEVRDERARDARAVFKEADEKAKVRSAPILNSISCIEAHHCVRVILLHRIWRQKRRSYDKRQTKRKSWQWKQRMRHARHVLVGRFCAFVLSTRDTKFNSETQIYTMVLSKTDKNDIREEREERTVRVENPCVGNKQAMSMMVGARRRSTVTHT